MRRHTQLAAAALYPPIGAEPTTVPDRAGNNDGTNNGAKVALVDDWTGLEFDGIDFVECENINLASGGSYTVEFFAYVNNFDTRHRFMGESSGWIVGVENQTIDYFHWGWNQEDLVACPLQELFHFAAVIDRDLDEGRFYLNGQIVATRSSPNERSTSAPFRLGNYLGNENPENGFAGFLSDVRIWNIARTQSAIQADMHKRLTGNEPGLVGYWPMQYGAHQ